MRNKNFFPKIMLLLLMAGSNFAAAQSNQFEKDFIPPSNPEWLTVRTESNINPEIFFSAYRDNIGLSVNDEMKLIRDNIDELGLLHQRYQQYHSGHKVEGGEFILHSRNGRLETANGKLLKNHNRQVVLNVNEANALEKAKEVFPAKDFMWLNPKMEELIKESKQNSSATYFPEGELVWMWHEYKTNFNEQQFELCWRFDIYVESGHPKAVFVNARTGEIYNTLDIAAHCDAGTGTTIWNGSINLNTHQNSPTDFVMWDDCFAPHLIVRNANGSTNGIGGWTDYHDADNAWNTTADMNTVQTYYGELMVYSYFNASFGRWSYDNAGANIVSYNNIRYCLDVGPNPPCDTINDNNACNDCFGTNELTFGNGATSSNNDNWNPVDIVGHEFSHGVTEFTSGLIYSNESGALNESYSDIFGEMTENFATGSMDWLVGNQRSAGAIRSLVNPNAAPGNDPDTYGGTNWYSGPLDNGGVHTNSGVQNFFFYLLVNGGSGTNDNGTGYSVGSISSTAAAWILYNGYVNYMTSSSNYADAREATIQQANNGFGSCSPVAILVGDVWYAVGVGNTLGSYNWWVPCGSYPMVNNNYLSAINILHVSGNCNVDINPSATQVTFTSAHDVILHPGFTAWDGSNFIANINPCHINNLTRIASTQDNPLMRKPLTAAAVIRSSTSEIIGEANFVKINPNPFTDKLTVSFTIDEPAANATLNIFNMQMQLVRSENLSKQLSSGTHTVNISTSNLAEGAYIVELNAGKISQRSKIVKMNSD